MEELHKFFDFKNNIDTSGKITFTMPVYAKATNSFKYVFPSKCYPRRNINNIPESIALRLRRICDSDEKFYMLSDEYQNYLIERDYNIFLVKK